MQFVSADKDKNTEKQYVIERIMFLFVLNGNLSFENINYLHKMLAGNTASPKISPSEQTPPNTLDRFYIRIQFTFVSQFRGFLSIKAGKIAIDLS